MWSALRRNLAARLGALNWPLVVVVAGFMLLIPLYSLWIPPLSWLAHQLSPDPFASYRAAMRSAAIKTPQLPNKAPLATIDSHATEVSLVAFKFRAPQSPLNDDLWVSLPSELKSACAGAPNAARTLRQILGLPPTSEPRLLYEVTVKTKDIIRPCLNERSPSMPSCSMDSPKALTVASRAEADALPIDKLREHYVSLLREYDELRFVAAHMWTSYQMGFPQDHPITPGDYPDKGFPFTGLGWTYNWRPSSASRVGVTEFVVRKDAEISVKPGVDPDTFCATEK